MCLIKDSNGNYRYTGYRRVVDKRTGEVTDAHYHDDWYRFSGILTSMFVEGQKCEIPADFKINICIASRSNSENNDEYRAYLKKLNSILSGIKIYSDVRFKGKPRRLDKSRELLPVEPTDIENAHEIYVSSNYMDTIRVDPPTKETREKQNQYAQSRAKERSREPKIELKIKAQVVLARYCEICPRYSKICHEKYSTIAGRLSFGYSELRDRWGNFKWLGIS